MISIHIMEIRENFDDITAKIMDTKIINNISYYCTQFFIVAVTAGILSQSMCSSIKNSLAYEKFRQFYDMALIKHGDTNVEKLFESKGIKLDKGRRPFFIYGGKFVESGKEVPLESLIKMLEAYDKAH